MGSDQEQEPTSGVAKTVTVPAMDPEARPPTAGSQETGPEDRRTTSFDLQHKVFAIEGACFRMIRETTTPALHVPLGDGLEGSVPLHTLRRAFEIPDDGHDARLLDLVAQGLKFVKEIRPGDSIPAEILDGSASWPLEDRHYAIAKARLSVQLISWFTGDESVIVNRDRLEQLAEDPQTKARVQDAVDALAERMGYGRANRAKVLQAIDALARELAYIEALRDRYALVRVIQVKLQQLVGSARLYKSDSAFRDDIRRMQVLIRQPIGRFDTLFAQVDAQTGEILAVLKNIGAQIRFIRQCRDDLRAMILLWDEKIDAWAGQALEKGPELEQLLKETYRFPARHYGQVQEWRLSNRP